MNRQEKLQDALEWVETLQENYGGQEETQDLAEALGVAAEAIRSVLEQQTTKALDFYKKALNRKTELYYKEGITAEENAEYYALIRLLGVEL